MGAWVSGYFKVLYLESPIFVESIFITERPTKKSQTFATPLVAREVRLLKCVGYDQSVEEKPEGHK